MTDPIKLRPNNSVENLSQLSNPPTEAELQRFEDIDPRELPPAYKRNLLDRIFVNRDLRFDRIKWIGFDMDYTLAQYISPAYETLSYNLIMERLVETGYPTSILKLKYDPAFPIRGLLLDTVLGHMLKVDTFGNITLALHGRKKLEKKLISELYPSLYISSDAIGLTHRFYSMDTLFNLPEACIYADLVEHLEGSNVDLVSTTQKDTPKLSYLSLFQDVRTAMDHVHQRGQLKSKTLEDLPKYVKKIDIGLLLDRMRKVGLKLALVTNSEYAYTEKIMTYLLGSNDEYTNWKLYFDVVIVSARKPTWFGEGTTLREVDLETGNLRIGTTDSFVRGRVYSGGGLHLFQNFTGARGNQVLYIGDHIYADIIKSKKDHAWRNLLIIPELEHELKVWVSKQKTYNHLINLEYLKAETFKGLDSSSKQPPDLSSLRKHIKVTTEKLDNAYNPYFGSLFRTGSKQSQFSMQVMRYADLYTYDIMNLLNYPLFYHFTAKSHTLPHEYLSFELNL